MADAGFTRKCVYSLRLACLECSSCRIEGQLSRHEPSHTFSRWMQPLARPLLAAERARRVAVSAWGKGKKADQQSMQVSTTSKDPASTSTSQPVIIKVGLALIVIFGLFQAMKRLSGQGSKGSLSSRGLIAEGEQNTRSNDPYFKNMMKNVNTIQYEELSEEKIAAARQRRSQDRRYDEKIDLDKIQLPANHPFAVSKKLSDEEEQLQNARLRVRRGMPLKDLNELKSRQERAQHQDGRASSQGNMDPNLARRSYPGGAV